LRFFLKLIPALLILLTLWQTTALCAEKASPAEAQRAFQQADYRQAEDLLKAYLSSHPREHEARKLLGQVYLETYRFREAVRELKAARLSNPRDFETLSSLTLAYLELKEYGEAQAAARQILAQNPRSHQGYTLLGNIAYEQNRFKQAEKLVKIALKLNPQYPDALILLGEIDQARYRFEQAETQYQKVLKTAPEDPVEYQAGLGSVYLQEKKYPEARVYLEQALKLEPDYYCALCQLASLETAQGEFDSAKAELEKARELAPQLEDAYWLEGELALRQDDLSQAREKFRQGLKLNPDYFEDLYFSLAQLEIFSGDLKAAGKLISQGLKINPNSSPGYALLGELELARGHYAKALRAENRAFKLNPYNDEALAVSALALLKSQKKPGLISRLRSSGKVVGAFSSPWGGLGLIPLRLGKNPNKLAARALKINPRSALGLYADYRLKLKAGKASSARKSRDRAFKLYPALKNLEQYFKS